MDIFDRIQELIDENKITAYKLSQDTGISTGLISQWKKRSQNPSGSKLQAISEYFGVSVDYLLGNEKKPIPQEDELIKDEFIAFYGEVKQDLDDDDIADLKTFIRMKSEIKRKLTEKK